MEAFRLGVPGGSYDLTIREFELIPVAGIPDARYFSLSSKVIGWVVVIWVALNCRP
jgi:hypothetical protein